MKKEKLQKFINQISGKPKLFERYCKIYNKNKNFANIDFSKLDFSGKQFFNFNFSFSDFSHSDFSYSDFSYSDFSYSDFSYSDFSYSDFSSSNFSSSNFSSSDFSSSNFNFSDFSSSNFCYCIGIFYSKRLFVSNSIKMQRLFKMTKDKLFWIAYKSFDEIYAQRKNWKIKEGALIRDHINKNEWETCGKGINVGTLKWCKKNCNKQIWELHIPVDSEICIPYFNDGKIRVSKAMIKRKFKNKI